MLTITASAWGDLGAPLVLAVAGGVIAAFWPWLQTSARGRKFEKLIKRELEEIGPHPDGPVAGKPWWEHATKRFVHEEIFDKEKVVENRDFLLSLDAAVVYGVSQLWSAFDARDSTQWVHFLEVLAADTRVGSDELTEAAGQWSAIVAAQPAAWLSPMREDQALREQLIAETTKAASSLYLETQRYWRATGRGLTEAELETYRKDVDARYQQSRIDGYVLEARLRAAYLSDRPRLLWHRVMDLLTVRYFGLTTPGGATAGLRKRNAGDSHTGLTAEELTHAGKVLGKYHDTADELGAALLDEPVTIDRRAAAAAK